MEGEAAAAILQVLVQNLIDHSKKEISLIRGLDKDAGKLTATLSMIQKFLNDAETRTIPGNAVKTWLKKLEDVAFDADSVLDELNYHLLSKKINPIKEEVLSCFLCSSFNNHIERPRKMARRIKEINDDLDSINKEATDLGLVARLTANEAGSLVDASFETASFTVDPIFIGRDGDVLELVEMLTTTGVPADEPAVFSILAIVGMGGLGKTTLTRKIFNHQKVETQFGSLIWVHVSRIFDPITLFKKILKELMTHDQVQVGSKQEILRKLQETLKDKTYLLVLDDVWNTDPQEWEDFKNSLLGVTSTKGNAIVLSARSMLVASIVIPLRTHELKGLSEEDCWSIIKAKTFGKEDVPSEMETIGRSIGKRCQGLPLAANVVGGVIRNNKSKEKWVLIEEKWLSHDEGENIMKILRLSFDSLSRSSLKKCFAYCSMFPKGHIIEKERLIEYWMAEGFLQDDETNDMEYAGEECFNELLHNSLLQVSWREDICGNVEGCVMHDLVHDLACLISSSQVRYRILEDGSSPINKEEAKHLRTLLLDSHTTMLFSGLERLRILKISSYRVAQLPSWVRKLIHLRHLDVSDTEIKYLPDWIGELHLLLTLRANTGRLKKLPNTIKYLINLRHLYIDGRVELPAEIGRLTCLQTLEHFAVGDKDGYKIEELGGLDNLKGELLEIRNLERVGGKEEAEKAKLFKKSKVSGLWLVWSENREVGINSNDENVLEGLQPHSDLKKLWIRGFKGRRFASWTLKMAVRDGPRGYWIGLSSLTELRLIDCSECEEIPMLGHLPHLKSLGLQGLRNVKFISLSFYGLVNKDTRVVFPALERLELHSMSELVEWAEVEFCTDEVKAPRLRHLEIYDCRKLTSVPTHFSSSCLQELEIRDSGLECLPDCLFTNNLNLSKLEIVKCLKLRELPRGLEFLDSLKELAIRDCPSLERMATDHSRGGERSPSQARSLTSLRRLSINNCGALAYLPHETMGPSLEKLSLVSLRSLENLPSLIDCLCRSPHLAEMKIIGVPYFMSTRVEFRPTFRSLKNITIDVSAVGLSSGSSMGTVDGILHACCHSLQRLKLVGMETWECLPESIQHVAVLGQLKLENIGMEELPEWFGNLSSLKDLSLCNCKQLRRLPSMDAMRRLTALEYLTIKGSPRLVIRSDDGGSEWPKASLIPYITIDGSTFFNAAD